MPYVNHSHMPHPYKYHGHCCTLKIIFLPFSLSPPFSSLPLSLPPSLPPPDPSSSLLIPPLPLQSEGPERSQWSRHASSVFFSSRGSNVLDGAAQISEGYLYKRGKIVRNWKQRWFVLDTEKKEVGV